MQPHTMERLSLRAQFFDAPCPTPGSDHFLLRKWGQDTEEGWLLPKGCGSLEGGENQSPDEAPGYGHHGGTEQVLYAVYQEVPVPRKAMMHLTEQKRL